MEIMTCIIITLCFFLLRSKMAKGKTFRGRMIFSIIFAIFIIMIFLISIITSEDKTDNPGLITAIIYTISFVTCFNIFDYYKNKETLNITNKGIKLKRLTVLKGYRVISLCVLGLNLLILLLNLFVNDFKKIEQLTISLIIILVIVTTWNIILNVDLKKQRFTKETVIIFNNETYVEYDVSKKIILNLKKYLKNIDARNSFQVYINEKDKLRVSWVYYVKNSIDNQNEINKYLYNALLNNDEDKVFSIDVDCF